MSIFNEKKEIIKHIEAHQSHLGFNEKIFEILEGDLLRHVERSLKEQLSESSYSSAAERIPPINLFKKVNTKLSTLYVDEPLRKVSDQNESDQELVSEYIQELSVDSFMEDLNKAFNAYKWSAIEIYEDDGLETRVLPSHQFLPYGNDPRNPTKVTAIIKFMGTFKKIPNGRVREKEVNRYWVYSNDEFMSIDSDGELVMEDMVENEGVNPFGVLPFIFVSKSRYLLVPTPDKDDLRMSILFPVLLSDLNFAAKYLAHSVFYGIDIDSDNLKLSPDAVWIFKSDEEGKKPEVGTITPQISVTDVLGLAKEQIASWIDTKNIKAGNIGDMDGGSASSGIAKMVDEADTTIERKAQVKFFKKVELQFWRVLAKMHNELVGAKRIKNMKTFSDPENLIVNVVYQEQKPLQTRAEKIAELKLERDAGFRSTLSSIKELNPQMTQEEIDAELALMDEEGTVLTDEQVDDSQDNNK